MDVYDLAEGTWSPKWQWSVLNGRAGTGIPLTLDPRIITLQAGSHWIEFDGRESASKVDRIIVTNDPNFVPTEGNVDAFSDTPPSNLFYEFIETIARNDVSSGCGSGRYCPGNGVTRAQMAVFLLKSKYGSNYVPPAATGTVFSDVPANAFAAAWIEKLAAEGITTGCGGGRYCPGNVVTRAQMAVFILRATHAPGYAPPPATGMFTDLQIGDPFTPWIEELAREGITVRMRYQHILSEPSRTRAPRWRRSSCEPSPSSRRLPGWPAGAESKSPVQLLPAGPVVLRARPL